MASKQSIAVRNISNRTLEYDFDDGAIFVRPGKVSEYYPESKWTSSKFAYAQLNKTVADKEAKKLVKKIADTKNSSIKNQSVATDKNGKETK